MDRNNICKFSSTRSTDLVCSEFVYENTDAQSKKTRSDRYIFGFVTNGKITLASEEKHIDLGCGSAFLIKPSVSFRVLGDDSFSYFYISFYGRRANEIVGRLDRAEEISSFDLSEHFERITPFVLDCIKRAEGENTDILSECTLLYLFSYLSVKKNDSDALLMNIIKCTEDNFTDIRFSLGTLAEKLNYDAKYLSFYFKKQKKITFSEYLRELRIKHSVFLIEQGITSIKNVALLSGFSDALYFSKVFKKVMGKSPKEYICEHEKRGEKASE